MTKEELENEAREYVKQNYCEMCVMADDCKCGCIDCFTVQSYLAGAEPREKRIAEFEAQIEKMKCCGNCKYYQFQNDAGYYTCTRDGKRNGKNYRSCEFNLEKWEGR